MSLNAANHKEYNAENLKTIEEYNAENLSLEETRTISLRTSNPCRRVRLERRRRNVQDGNPDDKTEKKKIKQKEKGTPNFRNCTMSHLPHNLNTGQDILRGVRHIVKKSDF